LEARWIRLEYEGDVRRSRRKHCAVQPQRWQSGTRLPMVASPCYHQLDIVQLRMTHRLTGEDTFARVADRWESYSRSPSKRTRALCYKTAFKLCYY
jgi:hypothetical protein